MSPLEQVKRAFLKLPPEQQAALLRQLLPSASTEAPTVRAITAPVAVSAEVVEKQRFKEGRYCPHCGGKHIVRHGKQADGTQRFCCRDCGKTFQATTKTVLGRSVCSTNAVEKLRTYVHCMCLELPLRQSARECHITTTTAFTWRHKILDALTETLKTSTLSGVVEFDETYFTLSFKGHRHMDKAAQRGITLPSHKRGGQNVGLGLNNRYVCVPVAVARNGSFVAKVSNLGAPKSIDVIHAIGGHCEAESVLCTDGGRPGQRLASSEGLECIPIKEGKGSRGIYNIQRVNAFHSSLKTMVNNRLHGVATKYLNNYVAWHGFMHAKAMPVEEREVALYEIALNATCSTTTRNLDKREAIPVLSKQQQRLMTAILLELSSAEIQDRLEKRARFQRKRGGCRPHPPSEKASTGSSFEKSVKSIGEDIPF